MIQRPPQARGHIAGRGLLWNDQPRRWIQAHGNIPSVEGQHISKYASPFFVKDCTPCLFPKVEWCWLYFNFNLSWDSLAPDEIESNPYSTTHLVARVVKLRDHDLGVRVHHDSCGVFAGSTSISGRGTDPRDFSPGFAERDTGGSQPTRWFDKNMGFIMGTRWTEPPNPWKTLKNNG